MHVPDGRAHKQLIALLNCHSFGLLCYNLLPAFQHLRVFILAEVVVLEFVAELVVGIVLELTEDDAEEDAHVRVVVERHASSLLDEEKHQAVVFVVLVNCYSVQLLLEVVLVCSSAFDPQLLRGDCGEFADHRLAGGVVMGAIQEVSLARNVLGGER